MAVFCESGIDAAKRRACAVPVAAPDSLERARAYADEAACLDAPGDFLAVGQLDGEFHQVADEEVIAPLAAEAAAAQGGGAR